MSVSAKDISSYINFLTKEKKLYISLHGKISSLTPLVAYNFHLHPLCLYVKKQCDCWSTCAARQHKVLDQVKNGEFFGICYGGMGEFVYPITYNNEVVSFISVSGYLGDIELTRQKQLHFAKKFGISYDNLKANNQELITPPDINELNVFIKPLVAMCEQFYAFAYRTAFKDSDLITDIIRYINEHHTTDITMKTLSERFNYSVSSLSHIFKKNTGLSISKYIEGLRIDDAKWLLKHTKLQVAEISSLLGFCNSGYFSAVFKKCTGVAPKSYSSHNAKES